MAKYIYLLFSVICFLSPRFNAEAQDFPKKKVAVYVSGDDTDSSIKKVFGSKLVGAISRSNGYAAVERTAEFLAALTAESDYQTSGEVRDSQIATLGQKFGVKYVVVADITESFDEYFISARLINVETGLVERSYDANGAVESMQQLVKLAENIANGMIILPEQEKAKKEQEARHQAQLQAQQEQERKMAQRAQDERLQQEAQQRLRATAEANLIRNTGYNCYRLGNYLIMNDIIEVTFDYDTSLQSVVSTNHAPSGWQIANEDILRLASQSGRYNLNVPHTYWVAFPLKVKPDMSEKFNSKKMLGGWMIPCYYMNMTYRPRKRIGETIQKKGSDSPYFKSNLDGFYTIYYRPMFTESEIQAEINRIK